GNEYARPRPKYTVDSLGVVWQVHLLADALRHLPDEPDGLRLQLLVRREIAFDKDLERVADNLRILIAERADALLQLGERAKIIVQAALYQQSRVSVFRWHCTCSLSSAHKHEPVDDTLPARHLSRHRGLARCLVAVRRRAVLRAAATGGFHG